MSEDKPEAGGSAEPTKEDAAYMILGDDERREDLFVDGRRQKLGRCAYRADSLTVYNKTLDFLTDETFQRAYRRGIGSGHQLAADGSADPDIEYRVYMAIWCALNARGLDGDFVECGVNTGMVSLAICDYLDFGRLDKTFYLFDTFAGIPESQMHPREKRSRTWMNERAYFECYDLARENFADFENVVLVRGIIPSSLTDVDIRSVSYLHLDMNIAEPEIAALTYFWPKMTPGGFVLLDDYAWRGYDLQKAVMDRFAAANNVPICTLPTGQGLLIKPR